MYARKRKTPRRLAIGPSRTPPIWPRGTRRHAPKGAFSPPGPRGNGRMGETYVDYDDGRDGLLERSLRDAPIGSGAKFMLPAWDHDDGRTNTSIPPIWSGCGKTTGSVFTVSERRRQTGNRQRKPCRQIILSRNDITNRFLKANDERYLIRLLCGAYRPVPWQSPVSEVRILCKRPRKTFSRNKRNNARRICALHAYPARVCSIRADGVFRLTLPP